MRWQALGTVERVLGAVGLPFPIDRQENWLLISHFQNCWFPNLPIADTDEYTSPNASTAYLTLCFEECIIVLISTLLNSIAVKLQIPMGNSSIWSIYNIQLLPVREAGEKKEDK